MRRAAEATGQAPALLGRRSGCIGALPAFGRSAEADGALSSGREEGSVHRPARLLGVRDEERLLVAEQQARRRLREAHGHVGNRGPAKGFGGGGESDARCLT